MNTKQKILTGIGFAEGIADSLYAQNKCEPLDIEILNQCFKIKVASKKAFHLQPYTRQITGKDLSRIEKKLDEMNEKTFISGAHDVVASISLCIAMLEDIAAHQTGKRQKSIENLIEELLSLQSIHDPDFSETGLYEDADKALETYNN